jgi:Ca-activated chloride channel family protein
MPYFSQPFWLLGLLLVPVMYLLYIRVIRNKRHEALRFSRVSVLKSILADTKQNSHPRTLFLLSLLTLSLLFVGLADPHIPLEEVTEGANVVLVLDVSGSMAATDYPPNRLESAKDAAEILLRQLDPNDYAGIVIFESGASSAAYLSPDRDRVLHKLEAIQGRDGNTALGDGLALGIDMASSIPGRNGLVILLSDGVHNAGMIDPSEAVIFAQSEDIRVYTVGIGSTEPAVSGYTWFGEAEYSALDEAALQGIADRTGGKYFRSVDSRTLNEIYAGLSAEIVRETEETSIAVIFYISAVGVILIEMYCRYGRDRIIP